MNVWRSLSISFVYSSICSICSVVVGCIGLVRLEKASYVQELKGNHSQSTIGSRARIILEYAGKAEVPQSYCTVNCFGFTTAEMPTNVSC